MKSLIALCLSAVAASSAQAQCSSHRSYAAPVQQQVYAAPQYQAYQQAYIAPVYYQPIALFVLPGTPTAALNIYPGQFTLIQPVLVAPVAVAAAPVAAGK